MARCQAGEVGAFDELARAHARDIFVLARGLLANAEDAQDVTQEVLITLYKHVGRLRNPRALRAWLSRVCVNRCRAVMRRRRGHEAVGEREFALDPANGPEQRLVAEETRTALRAAVTSLPSRQRTAFALRHFSGQSVEEIAGVLGCAPATVRVHLSRAVARLRDVLTEREQAGG